MEYGGWAERFKRQSTHPFRTHLLTVTCKRETSPLIGSDYVYALRIHFLKNPSLTKLFKNEDHLISMPVQFTYFYHSLSGSRVTSCYYYIRWLMIYAPDSVLGYISWEPYHFRNNIKTTVWILISHESELVTNIMLMHCTVCTHTHTHTHTHTPVGWLYLSKGVAEQQLLWQVCKW